MNKILIEISTIINRNTEIIKTNKRSNKIDFVTFLNVKPKSKHQKFHQGSEFYDIRGKHGKVIYLKDDEYEKKERKKDETHYNYSVEYDDGKSDTYASQWSMFTSNEYLQARYEYDQYLNS